MKFVVKLNIVCLVLCIFTLVFINVETTKSAIIICSIFLLINCFYMFCRLHIEMIQHKETEEEQKKEYLMMKEHFENTQEDKEID